MPTEREREHEAAIEELRTELMRLAFGRKHVREYRWMRSLDHLRQQAAQGAQEKADAWDLGAMTAFGLPGHVDREAVLARNPYRAKGESRAKFNTAPVRMDALADLLEYAKANDAEGMRVVACRISCGACFCGAHTGSVFDDAAGAKGKSRAGEGTK